MPSGACEKNERRGLGRESVVPVGWSSGRDKSRSLVEIIYSNIISFYPVLTKRGVEVMVSLFQSLASSSNKYCSLYFRALIPEHSGTCFVRILIANRVVRSSLSYNAH